MKELHLVTLKDIEMYCAIRNIDLQNLISQPYSPDRKKKIESIFYHYTQIKIKEDELTMYITSDHERKYQCSIVLDTKLKEIGALESVDEIKERINDMVKVKTFAIVNTLEFRDQLYSKMVEDIAYQYGEKDSERLRIREEELNFLKKMEIEPENQQEL